MQIPLPLRPGWILFHLIGDNIIVTTIHTSSYSNLLAQKIPTIFVLFCAVERALPRVVPSITTDVARKLFHESREKGVAVVIVTVKVYTIVALFSL